MPWSDPRSVPRDFGLVLPMSSDMPAGLWAFLQMRPVAHRVRLRTAAPRTCPAARSRSARSAYSNATGVVVTWTPSRCARTRNSSPSCQVLLVTLRMVHSWNRWWVVQDRDVAHVYAGQGQRPTRAQGLQRHWYQLSGRREDDRRVEGHRCRVERSTHRRRAELQGELACLLAARQDVHLCALGDGHLCGEVCAGAEPIDPEPILSLIHISEP